MDQPQTDIEKDLEREKEFLSNVKELGVETEINLMIKVYNEQLEQLVRMRFDSDIYDYWIIAEPGNKEHLEKKAQNSRNMVGKRKIVETIRKQIEKLSKGGANVRH